MKQPISEVYNIDNMEFMRTKPDKFFSLVVDDPPYGLGDKLIDGGTWSVKWQNKGSEWDKLPEQEYFEQIFRVSKNWVLFGANYYLKHLPNCRNFIAWHKPYMDGMHSMSNVELALTSFDMNAKKISINKDNGNEERIHICQKPVALYKWILANYAKEGDIIFDPHMGSQSSRIAAYDIGFDYYGCEKDIDYFNEGNKRFERFKSQLKMF